MPTVVIRRTRVTGPKIESQAFTSLEARRIFAPHAIGSAGIGSILPTQAVAERALGSEVLTRRKLSYMVQFGSVRVGTTRYYSFPRTYAATPHVALTGYGSIALPTGSVAYSQLMRVRLGSFSAKGTPTGYRMYIAYGSA